MYDSIIILGPTATGKTSISIQVAKKLKAEIVNADSMYIYKDLDIGTAKPTFEEMDNVIHHLIGFVDPKDSFNVANYRENAENVIHDIKSRNILPIIVGGTGFYIDSLIKNYNYGETEIDTNIREQLDRELKEKGKEHLYNRLREIDPETAEKLHVNDTMRVSRAIEIYLSSGKKKSEISNNSNIILKNPLIIGLNIPREELYDRINKRVDIMINSGLLEEIKSLINRGLTPASHQSMKGIGYKEIVDYLDSNISLEGAIDLIKQHTRNYAKRQITWFKRNKDIIWFNPLEDNNIVNKIIDLYNKK